MNYIVKEKDIKNTVEDFARFCDYISQNKPKVTKTGALPLKPCYEINQLLTVHEEVQKPSYQMNKYISLNLWFQIAEKSDLLIIDNACKGGPRFDISERYNIYKEMSVFTQYLIILKTYLYSIDIEELWCERTNKFSSYYNIDNIFSNLINEKHKEWKLYDATGKICEKSIIQHMMRCYYKFAFDFMNLGLLVCEDGIEDLGYWQRGVIEKLEVTNLGINMMKACETRKVSWFNMYINSCYAEDIKLYEEVIDKLENNEEGFLDPFIQYFEQDTINHELIDSFFSEFDDNDIRVFDFKVSYYNEFTCIIRCSSNHTFDDLHYAIQEAFEFDNDHLYSFYLDGKLYSKNAIHSPESDGVIFTNEALLGDYILRGNQRILYLFDYGDSWRFDITLKIRTDVEIPINPEIISEKGTPPEQYPDFW